MFQSSFLAEKPTCGSEECAGLSSSGIHGSKSVCNPSVPLDKLADPVMTILGNRCGINLFESWLKERLKLMRKDEQFD